MGNDIAQKFWKSPSSANFAAWLRGRRRSDILSEAKTSKTLHPQSQREEF
jgi:hypothetical protein